MRPYLILNEIRSRTCWFEDNISKLPPTSLFLALWYTRAFGPVVLSDKHVFPFLLPFSLLFIFSFLSSSWGCRHHCRCRRRRRQGQTTEPPACILVSFGSKFPNKKHLSCSFCFDLVQYIFLSRAAFANNDSEDNDDDDDDDNDDVVIVIKTTNWACCAQLWRLQRKVFKSEALDCFFFILLLT